MRGFVLGWHLCGFSSSLMPGKEWETLKVLFFFLPVQVLARDTRWPACSPCKAGDWLPRTQVFTNANLVLSLALMQWVVLAVWRNRDTSAQIRHTDR